MKVSINVKDNRIITKLKVNSTIGEWNKEYEAMIDTGAFNTAIPVNDVCPPSNTSITKLNYSGVLRVTAPGGFDDYRDIYDAALIIGEEDSFPLSKVVAIELDCAIIGREIISRYRWEIDFEKKQVNASLATF